MNTKKKRLLSLLLVLVMVCSYAVGNNSFTAFAAEESTVTADEIVLFEGTGTSSEWGQAVKLYSGSGFSKMDLTQDAVIAVTYESVKEPIISLQSWTHNDIWQNVSATYSLNGVAYFSVSEMMDVYKSAYGTGYTTAFQDLDAIYVSDAGVDLTVSKVTISSKELESNFYTEEGQVTQIVTQAYAQNTTNDWTWMSMENASNLLYKTETVLNAGNSADVFAVANDSANFGIQVSDTKLNNGDAARLKFHVGTVTVKAEGYDDLIIELNKDYNESYLTEAVSWGLTGNNTQIVLTDYLPTDKAEKVAYLQSITNVIADITLTDYEFTAAVVEGPEFDEDYTYPTTMRDITPMELVRDMKVGWNLGNTLESQGGETNWGNPVTKKKMIDTLKAAGFNTLRIPVRWDEHYIDDNYTIDPEYMSRVETVVNYALANDMYAIVNIHHNGLQSKVNEESKDQVKNELDAIWTQVATNFKDYGDQLVFETINEPRNGEDWVGNDTLYRITNEYNEVALSAIRQTGGNNETRLVMIPTYTAGAEYSKLLGLNLPEDDHIAVSIHAYAPYNFALNIAPGSQSTFGEADKAYIDKLFKLLNKTFVEKGIPVVVGEFGAVDKDNLEDRVEYTYYYAQAAGLYEIPCCWWDNGSFTYGAGEALGIFNRRTLTFVYPEILNALMEGWFSEKEVTDQDPDVMFEGNGTSSSWGQAVSLTPGLDFVYDDFKEGYVVAVEYQSENAPELILAGNTTGVYWVKVNPAKTYSYENTNIAYFTLTDMVNAYKNALADYDSYGSTFPTLSTIFIGDTGADLTVTKVYKTDLDGMKLPLVTVDTSNNSNYVSQTYNITALQGNVDLSKLKIVYSTTEMETEDLNVWCDYAGLLQDGTPWFTDLTNTVNTKIENGALTITFENNSEITEEIGNALINLRFAKADWSAYETVSNPVLKVYYNGRLVQ